jgi:hypothetical protein
VQLQRRIQTFTTTLKVAKQSLELLAEVESERRLPAAARRCFEVAFLELLQLEEDLSKNDDANCWLAIPDVSRAALAIIEEARWQAHLNRRRLVSLPKLLRAAASNDNAP